MKWIVRIFCCLVICVGLVIIGEGTFNTVEKSSKTLQANSNGRTSADRSDLTSDGIVLDEDGINKITQQAQAELKEITAAIKFCKDNNRTLLQVKKIVGSDSKNKKKSAIRDNAQNNKYLNGTKDIYAGIDDLIRMSVNIKDAKIDPGKTEYLKDVLASLYEYENKYDKSSEAGNFVNLCQRYQTYIIENCHKNILTKFDCQVLCMKVYKELRTLEAKDNVKNETKRDDNTKRVKNDIEQLMDKYKDYIGENGKYKNFYQYFNGANDLADKFVMANQEKKQIKNFQKTIANYETIPD